MCSLVFWLLVGRCQWSSRKEIKDLSFSGWSQHESSSKEKSLLFKVALFTKTSCFQIVMSLLFSAPLGLESTSCTVQQHYTFWCIYSQLVNSSFFFLCCIQVSPFKSIMYFFPEPDCYSLKNQLLVHISREISSFFLHTIFLTYSYTCLNVTVASVVRAGKI